SLHRLMTNLGGHDLATLIEAFEAADDEAPRCFIAYTIKGYGQPLAGHRDNHAGLMTPAQIAEMRLALGIAEGREWELYAGIGALQVDLERYLDGVPWRNRPLAPARRPAAIKGKIPVPTGAKLSTQAAFGSILAEIAK